MSHADYKKWKCRPVEFKKGPCRPVKFKKGPCCPVEFKKGPYRPVDFKGPHPLVLHLQGQKQEFLEGADNFTLKKGNFTQNHTARALPFTSLDPSLLVYWYSNAMTYLSKICYVF